LNYQVATGWPLFDGSAPAQFRAQVENRGNFQFTAGGKVQLVDLFDHPTATLDLTPEQVFPDDVGTLTTQWTAPAIGYFTARLDLETSGPPMVAEDRLLVVPWQQVL